jgi:hypothetical protein
MRFNTVLGHTLVLSALAVPSFAQQPQATSLPASGS